MPLHHLSLTGPDCGWTACGLRLSTAHERGDTTSHMPYSGDANEWMSTRCTCPECRGEWWVSYADGTGICDDENTQAND